MAYSINLGLHRYEQSLYLPCGTAAVAPLHCFSSGIKCCTVASSIVDQFYQSQSYCCVSLVCTGILSIIVVLLYSPLRHYCLISHYFLFHPMLYFRGARFLAKKDKLIF